MDNVIPIYKARDLMRRHFRLGRENYWPLLQDMKDKNYIECLGNTVGFKILVSFS